MARQTDKISNLINSRYFSWIREAIVQHGNVNIQALSDKFNILAGNTYFRNFVKDKNQEYLGISGLTSILDECGYTLKLVPVKNDDEETSKNIEDITKNSFTQIRKTVSEYAQSVKRDPKIKNKKGQSKINNATLINDGIMGLGSMDDIDGLFDDDDDELLVGTGKVNLTDNLKVDPIKLMNQLDI